MSKYVHGLWIALAIATSRHAGQYRIPLDNPTIQAAVDAAAALRNGTPSQRSRTVASKATRRIPKGANWCGRSASNA
jgi:hypothetical protein